MRRWRGKLAALCGAAAPLLPAVAGPAQEALPPAANVLILAPLPIEMRWAVSGCFARTHGVPCRVIETGAGKVNATFAATKEILNRRPPCVIQFGTAGWLREPVAPGTLVAVSASTQWDYGWHDAGRRVPRPVNGPRTIHRPRHGWRGSAYLHQVAMRTAAGLTNRLLRFWHADACHIVSVTCMTLAVTTGDTFVSDTQERATIAAQTGAHAMDMETAATAEVCARLGVPFLALRAVTHTPACNPVLDFRQAADQMVSHLAHWLSLILSAMDTNMIATETALAGRTPFEAVSAPTCIAGAGEDAYCAARAHFQNGNFGAAAALLEALLAHHHDRPWRCYRLLALC